MNTRIEFKDGTSRDYPGVSPQVVVSADEVVVVGDDDVVVDVFALEVVARVIWDAEP
jgi:hypothetical protein